MSTAPPFAQLKKRATTKWCHCDCVGTERNVLLLGFTMHFKMRLFLYLLWACMVSKMINVLSSDGFCLLIIESVSGYADAVRFLDI